MYLILYKIYTYPSPQIQISVNVYTNAVNNRYHKILLPCTEGFIT